MTDSAVRPADLQQLMREKRWIFLAEGILLLCGGLFAIIMPMVMSTLVAYLLGWMSIVVGILLFVRAASTGPSEDRLSTMVTGVLFGVIGVVLIAWPFKGLEGVTLLMAGFCILRGVMDLTGKPVRHSSTPGLQILSGIAGIVLGGLLLLWWPGDALWAVGLLFGIQLVFMGCGLLAIWNSLDHPAAGSRSTAD